MSLASLYVICIYISPQVKRSCLIKFNFKCFILTLLTLEYMETTAPIYDGSDNLAGSAMEKAVNSTQYYIFLLHRFLLHSLKRDFCGIFLQVRQ